VKFCGLYGTGFYYIPGSNTCIKIGGYVRAEWNYQANGTFSPVHVYNFDFPGRNRFVDRVRGGITVDVRSQTSYGTLRAYAIILPTTTNDNATGGSPYTPGTFGPGVFSPAVFIQFAGFTIGKTVSFFDFDLQPYSNQIHIWSSNQAGNGQQLLAYTARFDGGFSASLSVEDPTSRQSAIAGGGFTYQGRRWPDLVANLRTDQSWGSAQVMGAVHDSAAYATGAGARASIVGSAFGVGGRINLPSLGMGDYVLGQVTYSNGVVNYAGSQLGADGLGAMNLQAGYPAVTTIAAGPAFDAVGSGAGIQGTKAWSVTGGYEHVWNPQWKTSIYGAYGRIDYSSAAGAVVAGLAGIAGNGNADWSLWQIGSRTVWTPVPNLNLSFEALYTDLNKSAFQGSACTAAYLSFAGSVARPGCRFDGKGFISAVFRAQRNFWP